MSCFNEAEALKPRIHPYVLHAPAYTPGFNEAEALKPRILPANSDWKKAGHRRFNEAEALKPRIHRACSDTLHICQCFNEAEALKPRIQSTPTRQFIFVPQLQ